VGTQGAVPYEPDADLMETLIMAGGPTATAKLEDVRVIFRGNRWGTLIRVDLSKYTNKANPVPIFLQPGDVVYVPARRPPSAFVATMSRYFVRIALSTVTSLIIFRLVR